MFLTFLIATFLASAGLLGLLLLLPPHARRRSAWTGLAVAGVAALLVASGLIWGA